MIKALILDLDDTIFSTKTMDSDLFQPFIDRLKEVNDVLTVEQLDKAIQQMWNRPFDVVADQFEFNDYMRKECLAAFHSLEFNLKIKPYDDYTYLKHHLLEKFLVTTGIQNLQQAKIEALNLNKDFKALFIDDPSFDKGGKLKVFLNILETYAYQPDEVLVIGDNPESEIKAGRDLGMPTLLIDRTICLRSLADDQINCFSQLDRKILELNAQR